MADRFTVEPGSLRSAGSQLEQEAQVLAGALSRLQGRLGSLGDVTGDDDQGKAFAAAYQPKVELLERALQQMVKGLEIANPGSTNVRVVVNSRGDVVTVIPRH